MKVKIFSREDCVFCQRAKEFLEGMEIEYTEEHQPTGMVPQIYINEDHIGGYDDLINLTMTDEWDKYSENV